MAGTRDAEHAHRADPIVGWAAGDHLAAKHELIPPLDRDEDRVRLDTER